MSASLRGLMVVSLLVAYTHGQLCIGQVLKSPLNEPCGLQNISMVELFSSPGPDNRHPIDIAPCGVAYKFRLTMSCPALSSTLQVCDDETQLCTPCNHIHCWAHFFNGWVNEIECGAFNRTGTQRVVVTFPHSGPARETQLLHRSVPVRCPGEEPNPPPAPAPPTIAPPFTAPAAGEMCERSQDALVVRRDDGPQQPRPLGTTFPCGFPFFVEIFSSCRPENLRLMVCEVSTGICDTCTGERVIHQFDSGWSISTKCSPIGRTSNQRVYAAYLSGPGATTRSLNTTIPVECPQDERGCDPSRDLTLSVTQGNLSCGDQVKITIHSAGYCSLFPSTLQVCDEKLEHCEICLISSARISSGWEYSCRTITFDGTQIFNATYTYGPLKGTLSLTRNVSCPAPELCSRFEPFFDVQISSGPDNPRPYGFIFPCDFPFSVSLGFGCGPAHLVVMVCEDATGLCTQCPFSGNQYLGGWYGVAGCTTYGRTGKQTVFVSYQLGPKSEVVNWNKTVLVECPQDESGCLSSDVNVDVSSAGCDFAVLKLRSLGRCSTTTGGLQVCDRQSHNCRPCGQPIRIRTGFEFVCNLAGLGGLPIFIANYSYGPLQGTIVTYGQVPPCDNPFPQQSQPQIPPSSASSAPVPCNPSTVALANETPAFLQCGGLAIFNLSSMSGCSLSSGSILVCDSQRHNCEQISPTETLHPHGPVIFNLRSTPNIDRLSGPLTVAATYQVGPFIGTIATTLNKDSCPCTQ